MSQEDFEPKTPAPYNMGQIFYFELNRLIRFKDSSFLQRDIRGYNDGLKAIFRKIYFQLNPEEKQEVKKMFEEVEEIKSVSNYANSANSEILLYELLELLEAIDFRFSELFDKHKMIFPNIEIKSLETYERDLKL